MTPSDRQIINAARAIKPECELAVVWRGGGRRYLTKWAACRAEARAYLRRLNRYEGEPIPEEMFQREVKRMALEIKDGKEPTFDWDEAWERAKDDLDPRTPLYGVGT